MSTAAPTNLTPTFSGFLSNFISTSGTSGSFTDILSTVGFETNLSQTSSAQTRTNSGSYFYIGDLLIQFSNGFTSNQTAGYTVTQTFPTTFGDTPYIILATATTNNNYGGIINIVWDSSTPTTTDFQFYVANQNANITWLAIGPAQS